MRRQHVGRPKELVEKIPQVIPEAKSRDEAGNKTRHIEESPVQEKIPEGKDAPTARDEAGKVAGVTRCPLPTVAATNTLTHAPFIPFKTSKNIFDDRRLVREFVRELPINPCKSLEIKAAEGGGFEPPVRIPTLLQSKSPLKRVLKYI